jgi:hypothetical protein
MKKWLNIGFIALCALILIVLWNAPPETTKKTPNDKTHENPKQFERCPTCHIQGGEGPAMRQDHFNREGKLMLDHVKCYMCHKEKR